MAASRFHFLEEDFPGLYEICVRAEQASEYNVAMMQIRQAMERMIHDLGARNRELFRGINELEEAQLLDRETSRRFHSLRRIVNQIDEGREEPDKTGIPSCLDQLLLLTVGYGVKQGKTYGPEQFTLDDVPIVRRYLEGAGQMPGDTGADEPIDNSSLDPLRLEAPLSFSTVNQEQDVFSRDVFETQEEFEQRIASLEPVYIGCAILDTRRKDGYTDVTFLLHHRDHNPDIRFSPVTAFYTTGLAENKVIDGELMAKLRVHDDKVCCDYSQIYLKDGDECIAVQPVCWEKFFYESDEAYDDRISAMPLIPCGIGMPVRNEYDLTEETLPFVINPFQYAGKVFENLLSANKKVMIQCERQTAKRLCDGQRPCVLFLKLHTAESVAKSVLWRDDVGEISESNYQDALDWYQKGAHKGYGPAQNNLGNRYYDGRGIDKDYQKAVEWYRKAAEQGYAKAENNLGYCYYNGKGVDQDYGKAVFWYRKSAEQGHARAQNNLGICYDNGYGVENDGVEAVAWFRKAADKGVVWAQYNLGLCYHYGRKSLDKNREKAIEWYQKAAELGKDDEELQNRVREQLAKL